MERKNIITKLATSIFAFGLLFNTTPTLTVFGADGTQGTVQTTEGGETENTTTPKTEVKTKKTEVKTPKTKNAKVEQPKVSNGKPTWTNKYVPAMVFCAIGATVSGIALVLYTKHLNKIRRGA